MKTVCVNCKSSWDSTVVMTKCPFCGAELEKDDPPKTFDNMDDLIIFIRSEYGVERFSEKPKQLIGIMRDSARGLDRQIHLFRLSMEAGLPLKFSDTDFSRDGEASDMIEKTRYYLRENHYLHDEAIAEIIHWYTLLYDIPQTNNVKTEKEPVYADEVQLFRDGRILDAARSCISRLEKGQCINEITVKTNLAFLIRYGKLSGEMLPSSAPQYTDVRKLLKDGVAINDCYAVFNLFLLELQEKDYEAAWNLLQNISMNDLRGMALNFWYPELWEKKKDPEGAFVCWLIDLYGLFQFDEIDEMEQEAFKAFPEIIYAKTTEEDAVSDPETPFFKKAEKQPTEAPSDRIKNGSGQKALGQIPVVKAKYIGETKNGKRHGMGTMYFPDGKPEYRGEWKNDLKDGVGTSYNILGKKDYEGEWNQNAMHGKGKKYDLSGRLTYEGAFSQNKYEGFGTMYRLDGKKSYSGMWSSGYRNGNGVEYWANGEKKYSGHWVYGKKEGFGISYHGNGRIQYSGSWKDDLQHGEGSSYDSFGALTHQGTWSNGKIIVDKVPQKKKKEDDPE